MVNTEEENLQYVSSHILKSKILGMAHDKINVTTKNKMALVLSLLIRKTIYKTYCSKKFENYRYVYFIR